MKHLNPKAIGSLMGALDAGEFQATRARPGDAGPPPTPTLPFVTISRQAGVGATALAARLVERLNAADPGGQGGPVGPAGRPWTAWGRELVVEVATRHKIPVPHVAGLEDERPSWSAQLVSAMSLGQVEFGPEELMVYHRMVPAIRELAERGRAVLVGYGSAFITSDIKGGVHVRVVAPEAWRVANVARSHGISEQAAAERVRRTDRNREAFYHRHFEGRPVTPEQFTVIFNAAAVERERMVEALVPLIVGRGGGPARAAGARPGAAEPAGGEGSRGSAGG